MKLSLQGWFFLLPLLWSRVYTVGLPREVRDDRLTKIASDVYEQRAASSHEPPALSPVLEMLLCVVLSIREDLLWRFQKGHQLRVAAIRAGHPPFPSLVTALFALAGFAGAVRLSAVHHLPWDELTASILALLVGPLIAVLGVLIARYTAATGLLALVSGALALIVGADSLVAPVSASVGMLAGLSYILELSLAKGSFRRFAAQSPAGPSSVGLPSLEHATEAPMHQLGIPERWMLLGVAGVVIGLVTAGFYGFSFPYAGSDEEIRAWYSEDRNFVIYAAFLGGIASGIGLIFFFGGIYGSVRRAEGGAGSLAALMLAAATAAVALHMLGGALRVSVGMAYQYNTNFAASGIDPQMIRHIDTVVFAVQSMSSAILAVALGALATVALRSRQVCPGWLGWLTAAVAVLLLLDFPLFGIPFTVFVAWSGLFVAVRFFPAGFGRKFGRTQSGAGGGGEVALHPSTEPAE